MNKREYEDPAYEIIVLETDRVIRTSNWEIGPQPIEEGGLLAPPRRGGGWEE